MSTDGSATATDPHAETLSALTVALGEGGFTAATFRDNVRVYVSPERLIDALRTLKGRGFALLAELGGTDYLAYPGRTGPRFEVHYCLLNLDTRERIIVK